MKTRTMIYLEPHQFRALEDRARERGVSVAEVVRRLVSEHLEGPAQRVSTTQEAYRGLVGLGSSGLTDVSERHDAYLGAAVLPERLR